MRKKALKYKVIEHLTSSYEARVKFSEADSLGIVWHGNHIAFFEEGREAFGREHNLTYLDVRKYGFVTPIVNVSVNYKHPLKYGDIYTIKTYILNNLSAKIIHQYKIYNQDKKLVCEGETTQVFLDLEGNIVLYPPEFYQEWRQRVGFFEEE